MDKQSPENKISNFFSQHKNLIKEPYILVAVSGGIDSTMLAWVLKHLGKKFAIGHCNFKLRGDESDGDEEFVKNLAHKFSVPFHVQHFDTENHAQEHQLSTQMAARDLRYHWFKEIASKHGYDFIATAHNLNDSIETFFINLVRGTGIRGISGIKPVKENIIRPMLEITREEIESFVSDNNIAYREDSSNREEKYTRNKIRHSILPEFLKLSPSFLETMMRNMENLHQMRIIYERYLERELANIVNEKDSIVYINIPALKDTMFPDLILHEALAPNGFNHAQINNILNCLDETSGKQFFSSSHHLIKDRDTIQLTKKEETLHSKELHYIFTGDSEISSPLHLELITKEKNVDYQVSRYAGNACLDYDKLDFPLILRRWKQGDYFRPLGMKAMKKVSDFFTDQKLSLFEKSQTWILTSSDKIVWIVGKRIDDRFKVTDETTKVFEIKIK